MAGAGFVIIFVVAFVGCVIWSLIFLTIAAHYFLTTIIDSSGGHDEVEYPSEAILDWWWKPIFCGWVLGVYVIPVAAGASRRFWPGNPWRLVICLGLALWILYPIGILSALYTQNWLFVLHPGIVWRMLRHYGAFAYVHLITLLSAAHLRLPSCSRYSQARFLWALPATFLVPTTLLFYARNWGRFAWLSLNFLPRPKKNRFAAKKWAEDGVPVMDVEEVDLHAEAIREGMPTGSGHAFQSGVPTKGSPHIRAGATPWAAQEAEEDEWATDKKPYGIDNGGMPSFKEELPTPMPAVSRQTGPTPAIEEEEDEWAPVKKPYKCEDPTHLRRRPTRRCIKPEADRPVVLSNYDERARKEKAEARARPRRRARCPA